MPTNDENVVPFPNLALVERVKRAMADHKTAESGIATNKRAAILAVIEYGRGLNEGKADPQRNTKFPVWVHDNGFDVGKPWSHQPERSSAMRLATIYSTDTINAFDGCPNTTPTNIMSWWRANHPDEAPRRQRGAGRGRGAAADPEPADEPEATDEPTPATTAPAAPEATPEPPSPVPPPPAPAAPAAPRGSTPAVDAAYAIIVETRANGIEVTNWRTYAETHPGPSHTSFQIAQDRLRREEADAARTVAAEDAALASATFSETSRMTIERAITIHKARLEADFERRVGEEVRRRIAAADDAVRTNLQRIRERNTVLERQLGTRGVISARQHTTLIKMCHPDTYTQATADQRTELLEVLQTKKHLFINPGIN
jgi:hypothetical protein